MLLILGILNYLKTSTMKKLLLLLLLVPMVSFGQNKWVDAFGETAKAYYLEGTNTLDDNEKRISLFTKAIELDSLYSGAFYLRAIALHQLKRYDSAIVDNTKIIDIGGGYVPNAYHNRAMIKEQLGDIKGACIDYSIALNLGIDDDNSLKEWIELNCEE